MLLFRINDPPLIMACDEWKKDPTVLGPCDDISNATTVLRTEVETSKDGSDGRRSKAL